MKVNFKEGSFPHGRLPVLFPQKWERMQQSNEKEMKLWQQMLKQCFMYGRNRGTG